jgi:hypothetical protein
MQIPDSGAPIRPEFGGGAAGSVMHPVVMVAMVVAIVLMLVMPRKRAVAPFLFVVFLTPFGQQLNIAGVHFFVLRIVVVFFALRLAFAKLAEQTEIASGGLNAIDKAFCGWMIYGAMAITLLSYSVPALINQCGGLLDGFGAYFILRFLIQDRDDALYAIKALAGISLVIGICMLNEKLRMQNVFGYLGSVPIEPSIREGSVRSQGPFGHPILAGAFAATLMPLFLLIWKSGYSKAWSIAGTVGSTLTVICSSSSTSLLAYLAVVFGVCMWVLRKQMRIIRWGIVFMLVSLHLIMKAPVWYLIAHVDLIAGNSGDHRATLINLFITHFSDWWLIGTKAMTTWGWDMWDLSNEFVAQGELGGLVTFACFIAMITIGFSWIGKTRKVVEDDRQQEWIVWLLGVALFSHVVAFFGISYWDQTRVSWYLLFAIISAICVPVLKAHRAKSDQAQKASVSPQSLYRPVPVIGSTRNRLVN